MGHPDTLRVRMKSDNVQLKSIKILVETAFGNRVTAERPIEVTGDEITVAVPVNSLCDADDLGNFPLHLVYYYITYNSVTTGEQYSLQIPGMELVYANVPQEEYLTGDVNRDGEVNIADVNTVIDFIVSGVTPSVADVNNDGEINIADINAIIDLILG